jgi:hypothetical protein
LFKAHTDPQNTSIPNPHAPTPAPSQLRTRSWNHVFSNGCKSRPSRKPRHTRQPSTSWPLPFPIAPLSNLLLTTRRPEIHSPIHRNLGNNPPLLRRRSHSLQRRPPKPPIPQPTSRIQRPFLLRRTRYHSSRRHRRKSILET